MPRRKQDEAVAEQAQESPAKGTPRRRGRRAGGEAEPQDQTQPKRERAHADLLTVAFRGPLAGRFGEMAERHQLSLAKLLQDALLAYEGQVAAGYQPGSSLAEWKAQQTQESDGA